MTRFALSIVVAFAAFTASSLPAQTSQAVTASRIVQPVDENTRVTLHGYVHPLANAANDRGVAPDSMPLERMHLVLRRSASQEATLHQLITDLHTPGTASYHKWLTPDQFGQQFGPSDQDIATVESWLSSHGFEVTGVKPGKQAIEFTGSVAQLRDAFHAQIHKYEVNGATHYATASDPQIPAALAPVVAGFASLNNFRPKKYSRVLGKATYNTQTHTATPSWTYGNSSGVSFVVAPADFAVQYDLSPLYTAGTKGSGQTIAIINDSNINVDLANQFRTLFSLPSNPPQVIIDGNDPGVDGINNPDGPNYDSGEAYLDVEWSGAVAPDATIDLVIGADTAIEDGLFLAAEHAIYGNVAPVMSISFGECELGLGSTNSFLEGLWEQAAAQGITVMVSTGDSGSAGCDNDNSQYYAVYGANVSGYASTPYNVAVGGTDFYYSDYNNSSALNTQLGTYWNPTPSQSPSASLLSVIPEQPWNDSQFGLDAVNLYSQTGTTSIAGGSGGASSAAVCSSNDYDSSTGECDSTLSGYPKPSWQTGVTGTTSDKVRDIPDVSLFAADGLNYSYYPTCAADADCQSPSGSNLVQFSGVGGTSASSPAFAGIMALVNQKYGRQGQADFVLYPLKTQFPAAFHDISNGTNAVPCNLDTVVSGGSTFPPTNCITAPSGLGYTITDPTYGSSLEGEIGTGSTPEYKAAAGYNLATGLGSVDANQLVTNWGSVSFKSTTTTLTSPTASASYTHGTAVTVSGSVSGSSTPTGNVSLMTDSATPLKQGVSVFALSNGSFSSSIYYLPGGTYNVWAQYGGDGTNGASTSSKAQITVNPESSTSSFNLLNSASGTSGNVAINPGTTVPYGTQLILADEIYGTTFFNQCVSGSGTAAICTAYDPPSGTVTFADNGTTINTAQLNAEGDAEYNAAFSVGNHSVTASYAGDAGFKSSSGTAIAFTVGQATPAISVGASNQTSATSYTGGQPTVLNIQVENTSNATIESTYGMGASTPAAAPTGTVTVTGLPGGTLTATLASAVDPSDYFVEGVGTVTLPASTAAGTYHATISYGGDKNYASTSTTATVVIAAPSGVASSITASTTGSVSPITSVSVTGTVTGKSGDAAPTGSVEFFSSGFALGSVGVTAGSGDTSTFTASLTSQTLFQGSNLITVQYSGDKTYAPSSTTLSAISSPLSDFSMVPNSVNIPVTAGSSGSDTIQLYSVNGFSGSVTYTCTAASGVTCSLSPTTNTFTANGSATTSLSVSAASSTSNGSYNVLITGTDSTGAYVHTLGLTAIVTGAVSTTPSYALTNSGSVSVTEGSSGTSTVSVTPSNGFTGTVNLACAVTGGTGGVTCSLSPTTAAITGTAAVTSTLTVNTSSTSGALHLPLEKFLTGAGGATLALVFFLGIPARRRNWQSVLGLLVVMVAIAGLGCGSSGGSTSNSQTYTVTVTGTSGTASQSTSVSVTVNK